MVKNKLVELKAFTYFRECKTHCNVRTHLKTGKEEVIRTIEDGQVVDETMKVHTYLAANKEQFFIGYASMLGMVYEQLTGPEIKVYAYLLDKYNSGSTIGIVKGVKEEMTKAIKIKLGTIDNALSGLVKKRMIYSTGKAVYKLNPRYAFKGPTANRDRLLKYILEVECPDC
jgi:hypothetical protein